MFGIFKNKKKGFDLESYVRDMIFRDSKLNIRDNIASLTKYVIREIGYGEFSKGVIVLNDELHVVWANPIDGRLYASGSKELGRALCGAGISILIEESDAFHSKDFLKGAEAGSGMDDELIDYGCSDFANLVCRFYAKHCEVFRGLPEI